MYQYTHSSLKSGTFLKSKFSCLHFFRTLIPEYCVEPTETVEVPDLKAAVILRCLYGKCKKQSCCNTQASSWEQTHQLKDQAFRSQDSSSSHAGNAESHPWASEEYVKLLNQGKRKWLYIHIGSLISWRHLLGFQIPPSLEAESINECSFLDRMRPCLHSGNRSS